MTCHLQWVLHIEWRKLSLWSTEREMVPPVQNRLPVKRYWWSSHAASASAAASAGTDPPASTVWPVLGEWGSVCLGIRHLLERKHLVEMSNKLLGAPRGWNLWQKEEMGNPRFLLTWVFRPCVSGNSTPEYGIHTWGSWGTRSQSKCFARWPRKKHNLNPIQTVLKIDCKEVTYW